MYKFHAFLSSLLLQIFCIDVRSFIFSANFLFLWENIHKVQGRKFCKLRHQMEGSLNHTNTKNFRNQIQIINVEQWILRPLLASKIAANYICMFTTLSYLNKISLYENVNSYLLVAHLELENDCISQSFFYSFKNRF